MPQVIIDYMAVAGDGGRLFNPPLFNNIIDPYQIVLETWQVLFDKLSKKMLNC